LTANGKLDREALPPPEMKMSEEGTSYIAPRTAVEEILAGIFTEVLKLDQIGVHDDFFQQGGHSILAIQLVSRVKDAFDMRIEMRSLFEAPTVAKLAEALIAQEVTPGRTERVAQILQRLDAMSDQDIDTELAILEQSATCHVAKE